MAYFGITSGPWLNPTSGTVVIAYALHKVFPALCEHSLNGQQLWTCASQQVFAPVKAAITVAITPKLVAKYGLDKK